MSTRVYHVPFLCTGNSARSILAEVAMNPISGGHGRFRGYSAGSHPQDEVNPCTLERLRRSNLPAGGRRRKGLSLERPVGDIGRQ